MALSALLPFGVDMLFTLLQPYLLFLSVIVESAGNTDAFRFEPGFWNRYLKHNPIYRHLNPRLGHAMAYDGAREVVVLQGGIHANGNLSPSTWEWNGSTWAHRSGSGPANRAWHAMAYDSNRNVVVLFGGWNNGTKYRDTWEWNGAGWNQTFSAPPATPPASPNRRWGHAMAYDQNNGVAVLFGGS